MNRFQTLTAGAALAALVSVPAVADDDSGWYIGASANWLSADDINVTDADFDDSDTAYGFKGGYMFTDLLGIEGGYMDLGSYQATGNTEGNNLNLDVEGWYIAGILNFSFAENWDAYGKLGAFAVDSNTDFTDFDESSTEIFGGLGIEYDFGAVNLFGEFDIIDTDTADLVVDVISVGLKYEF
jgi:OOP family OmpA-OmpF porin